MQLQSGIWPLFTGVSGLWQPKRLCATRPAYLQGNSFTSVSMVNNVAYQNHSVLP